MADKAFHPQIGVNLYSVREQCRTEPDLDRTLGRLKDIGYRSVQVSGIGQFNPTQIRHHLDRHGLTACATHGNLDSITNQTAELIATMTTLGCNFVALGHPGDEMLEPGRLQELRDRLVEAGQKLASAGMKLGYHNHAQEFTAYQSSNILAWLYDTSPETILFAEPDTCWIQVGGGSPVAWIRRLAKRIPAIHLKDYTWLKDRVRLCEVGHGNLDWPEILTACQETQIPIWIVEQDEPVAERDIFASLALSLATIHSYLQGVES